MLSEKLIEIQKHFNSTDSDIRYMGISDLNELLLSNNFQIQNNQETELVAKVLSRLEDPSSDVQSIAVKTIDLLIQYLGDHLVKIVVKTLFDSLYSSKEEQRDIYTMAIYRVINSIPQNRTTVIFGISKETLPKLLKKIQTVWI
ncbi:TIP120 domain-containing protein [Anaeramoeba flamelloides]|uniref:TIP120 domain-containing protein n=1 Tax=Anaeramoeba flamelloides TaxID=1746091 RepID=A0ABQ8YN63_9EUKA|nr:TIP120 domain-containing protein [Anaeramoeba flamelloides]